MAALRDVLLRESFLNALAGFPGGATVEALALALAPRLHRDVFPTGVPLDELRGALARAEAVGLVAREGARVRRLRDPEAERASLADWFEALGGLTDLGEGLHRCPLPATRAHFDALREAGVRVLYSFESAIDGALAREAGLDWRLFAWVDNGRPSVGEMDAFLTDLRGLPPGTRAALHCKAGLGRTGMAAACALAARNGWDAEAALEAYWARLPLARDIMEKHGQADFVRAYARRAVGGFASP